MLFGRSVVALKNQVGTGLVLFSVVPKRDGTCVKTPVGVYVDKPGNEKGMMAEAQKLFVQGVCR